MQWSQTSVIRRPRLRWAIVVVLAAILLLWGSFYRRLHAYDAAIAEASRLYGVDARLIRAVIWKESRFHHRRVGSRGEIGLMQIMPDTARDWARASQATNFAPQDLFQPAVNIRAGAWYLDRALRFWAAKSDPLPYALAEYNAGRANSLRWAANDRGNPDRFRENITFPKTREYVRDILTDYRGHR